MYLEIVLHLDRKLYQMKNYFLGFFLVFFSQINLSSQVNFFDSETLKCIVLIEKSDSAGKLIPHGTGFILYNYKTEGEAYVVTCEHVLRNKHIFVRLPITSHFRDSSAKYNQKGIICDNQVWTIDGNTMVTTINLKIDSNVVVDALLDIGVFKMSFAKNFIKGNDTILITQAAGIPRSYISLKNEIEIGTEINFLGFPFSIGTKKGYFFSGYYADEDNTPLLRTGAVAWKSKKYPSFLLDATSYSGNSGSPIFTKSGVLGQQAKLIGIIIGHLNDPRFGQESDINVGLAEGIWIDEVLQLINKKGL